MTEIITVEEYRKQVKKRPTGLIYIEEMLKAAGIEFVREFVFASPRRYRADIYVPAHKILIEYEGIGFNRNGTQSVARHTTLIGYTNDCDKYNLAVSLGYKVFRYTAKNYKNIRDLIDWVNEAGRNH